MSNLKNGSNGTCEEGHLHVVSHEEDDEILVDAIRYKKFT